jgi:hypothetical protein
MIDAKKLKTSAAGTSLGGKLIYIKIRYCVTN